MPSYIPFPALEAYYSDMLNPGIVVESQFGLDPQDPLNVNYVQYNKPYNLFKRLGGIHFRLVLNSISLSAGDRLDYVVHNITTQNISTSTLYSRVFQNSVGGAQQDVMVMIGMPALRLLGPGVLEGFGTLTKTNPVNTVYVIGSTYRTLVLP